MVKDAKKILVLTVLAALAVSFVVLKVKQEIKKPAVDNEPVVLNNGNSDALKKFKDTTELENFLANISSNSISPTMMSVRSESATMDKAVGMGGGDYSETNNQVEGVAEADIVKTDGQYIYTLSYNSLIIVRASDLTKVAEIAFSSMPQEFYISGTKLVAFGYDQRFYQTEMYRSFLRQNPFSFLQVYDLANISQPVLVKDLSLEGSYFSSRLIGSDLYFIINNYSFYNNGGPLLPRIMSAANQEDLKLSPDVYYFDRPYQTVNFVTVASLDLNNLDSEINSSIYLTNPSQNIYMSEDFLYLTDTVYEDSYALETKITKEVVVPFLNQADKDKITRIENVADDILSSWEKQSKIQQVIESYLASLAKDKFTTIENSIELQMKLAWPEFVKNYQTTYIYKIKADNGNLSLTASASVSGRVLNQFSMDEYQGYFRLATTRDQISSRFENLNTPAINNLYILDGEMKVVGSLENLASGEHVYSARFLGDKAFVVTYERTDPLMAIDLKDPNNPKVAAELKIPGFSSYLHSYSDKYLIGLGTDTEDQGEAGVKMGGIKLSLFDISDLTNPQEVDTYITGEAGSYSVASQNHKAFLFSADKNLLVLPVQLTKKNYQTDFSGALVFSIDEAKFNLRDKLSGTNVQRTLYVGDNLYTLSPQLISSYKISDLSNLNSLKLPERSLPSPMPLLVK